jgi:hypothetical protein
MKTLSFQSFCPLNPHGILWLLHSCRVFARKALSVLSFHEHSDPLGDLILLLPQMENINAFLAFSSSNLLVESFWLFSNPIQVPQWTLLSASELQEFFPPVPACTLTQRPPGGVSFLRTLSSPGFLLRNLCTRSMPFWQSFSESSAILVFLKLSTKFFPNATRAYAQCPLGRAPTGPSASSVCDCVSATQPCLQGVQQPCGFPPELMTSVCASARLCLTPHEFRSATSVHGHQNLNVLSHPPSVKPQRPST